MNAFLICSILLLISSDFVIGQEKVRSIYYLYYFCACIADSFTNLQLHVGVYYESLCPDSILFIENQLLPNYKHFGDLIDIDFVPFGKSSSLVRADGIEFTCQHGRYECEGNRIQSCALTAASNRDSQMVFVACQMSRYAEPSGQMVSTNQFKNCSQIDHVVFHFFSVLNKLAFHLI